MVRAANSKRDAYQSIGDLVPKENPHGAMHGRMAYKVTQNKSTQQLLKHVMINQTLEKITPRTANFTWAK